MGGQGGLPAQWVDGSKGMGGQGGLPAQGRLWSWHQGATYQGATYQGATYQGATYQGSTYQGRCVLRCQPITV
jgi:hypothetical protein